MTSEQLPKKDKNIHWPPCHCKRTGSHCTTFDLHVAEVHPTESWEDRERAYDANGQQVFFLRRPLSWVPTKYSRGVNLELRLGTDGHEEGRKHSDCRLHSCLNFEGRRKAKFVAREVSGGERRRRGRDEENVFLREREIERAGIYCEAQCRLWEWKHVNRDKVMMP